MIRIVGMRVVRGPHWQGKMQDGGEGGLGTVVSTTVESPAKRAVVFWDCGTKASYRIGDNSSYDLRIIDNAASGVKHKSVTCTACSQEEIVGIRWKCKVCTAYNLCTTCYMDDQHDVTHAFLRITEPSSTPAVMPQRKSSTRLDLKGICPGAIVSRSSDWKWGDQDGGNGQTGVVTEITNWPGTCYRDAVRVNWSASQRSDLYRFGHEGKVDVVATSPHTSGSYYPLHLPNLGELEKKQTPSFPVVPNRAPFAIGDKVRVNVPAQVLANMQEGHGGWLPEMRYVIERVGVVRAYSELGNVQVEFDSSTKYFFNPAALTKFVKASVGDIVKIIGNAELAKTLQTGHGGWVDTMAHALGKIGKVHEYTPNGDFRVHMGWASIVWNPECCTEPTNADKEHFLAESFTTGGAASDGTRKPVQDTTEASSLELMKRRFQVGDDVTIISDATHFKELQDGHGGWNDDMAKVVGKTGQVTQITPNGNLQVQVLGRTWWLNPACCLKVSPESDAHGDGGAVEGMLLELRKIVLRNLIATQLQERLLSAVAAHGAAESRIKVGDFVKIDNDARNVKAHQIGHGGWNDMMLLALGKTGKVISTDAGGDVQVDTGLFTWTFNPACLEPITDVETGDCVIS